MIAVKKKSRKVTDKRPERKGQVFSEDLFVGMKLQPHPLQGSRPITVTDVGDEKWFWADIHFDDGPPPASRKISKADKGMQPYENGLWHAHNWCIVIEEALPTLSTEEGGKQ